MEIIKVFLAAQETETTEIIIPIQSIPVQEVKGIMNERRPTSTEINPLDERGTIGTGVEIETEVEVQDTEAAKVDGMILQGAHEMWLQIE